LNLPHQISGKDHPSIHDGHDAEVFLLKIPGDAFPEFLQSLPDSGSADENFQGLGHEAISLHPLMILQ